VNVKNYFIQWFLVDFGGPVGFLEIYSGLEVFPWRGHGVSIVAGGVP